MGHDILQLCRLLTLQVLTLANVLTSAKCYARPGGVSMQVTAASMEPDQINSMHFRGANISLSRPKGKPH
jgi:hypothetical protein